MSGGVMCNSRGNESSHLEGALLVDALKARLARNYQTQYKRKCTKYDLSFSGEGVWMAPRTRTTRQSGARSPSSASTWPRFGALARQVEDRDNAGRPVGAGEAAEPELSPTSESNDSGLREPLEVPHKFFASVALAHNTWHTCFRRALRARGEAQAAIKTQANRLVV